MKNINLFLFILVIVIIIGSFFYFFSNQEEQKVVTVKISDRGLASSLPIYVAIEKGYFEKYGLSPQLIKLTTGNQVFDALIKNDLDIGEMGIDAFIFAEDKSDTNVKIALVGKWSENTNNHFEAIFVKNSSQIKSINQLENTKIGVFPGVTAKTFLKYYLNTQGVNTNNIQFIEIAPTLQIASLESGAIDALYAYQTVMTSAENSGFSIIDESLFNKMNITYYAIYGFSPEHISSLNSDKSLKALEDATVFIKQNEQESREILSKYSSLGNLSFRMRYYPDYSIAKSEDTEKLNSLIAFYENQGLIENSFDSKDLFYKIKDD
jgi:NitT/TauT family transport system substrate-binding protein